MNDTAKAAAEFWDQQITRRSVYWTEHHLIAEYVNECITGVSWVWPLVALKAGWTYKPLKKALSIGCGTGSLERSISLLNVASSIVGMDVSKASVREAKRLAKQEKLRNIRYRVENADALVLPPAKYNGVFFYQSLHHISDPDRLLREVRKTLVPEGLVYVDDYVGPARDEWTDDDLVHARAAYEELIPPEMRILPVNPPLDWHDPSEMIRSSRILPAVRDNFEILHERPYWGNLLFPLFCAIDGEAMLKPENEPLVRKLIEREKELAARGEFKGPLFALVVGRKT